MTSLTTTRGWPRRRSSAASVALFAFALLAPALSLLFFAALLALSLPPRPAAAAAASDDDDDGSDARAADGNRGCRESRRRSAESPPRRKIVNLREALVVAAEISRAWSALDVFVVSALAAATQIRRFAAFILGDACDGVDDVLRRMRSAEENGGGGADILPGMRGVDSCFDVETSLGWGWYVLAAAATLGYVSAAAIGRARFERGGGDEGGDEGGGGDEGDEYASWLDAEERGNGGGGGGGATDA